MVRTAHRYMQIAIKCLDGNSTGAVYFAKRLEWKPTSQNVNYSKKKLSILGLGQYVTHSRCSLIDNIL